MVFVVMILVDHMRAHFGSGPEFDSLVVLVVRREVFEQTVDGDCLILLKEVPSVVDQCSVLSLGVKL